jgi:hypothetical protein
MFNPFSVLRTTFMAEIYESNLHAWHADRCKSKRFIYRIEYLHTHVLFILACPSFGLEFVTHSSSLIILILCSFFHIAWDLHLSYRAIVPSTFDNPHPVYQLSPPLQLGRVKFVGYSAPVLFYSILSSNRPGPLALALTLISRIFSRVQPFQHLIQLHMGHPQG